MSFPLPADSKRLFVVEEFNAPPVSVFEEDFDNGQGGWIASTGPTHQAGTDWQWGSPSLVGPPAAHSGANCFGTNLSANSAKDAEVLLTSPSIDLTTAGGATLNFYHFTDIEDSFDTGSVVIIDAANDSEVAVLDDAITGFSGDWELFSESLPAAAQGKIIKIQFQYQSDGFDDSEYPGWYIDSVNLTVP